MSFPHGLPQPEPARHINPMNFSPDIIGMEDTNAAGCSIELILRPMLLSLSFDGIRHAAGFDRLFFNKR